MHEQPVTDVLPVKYKRLRFAYIARDIIGASGIGTDTPKTIWLSICRECEQRNISLSTYIGAITGEGFENFIYEMVSEGTVDGIISWATTDEKNMQKIIKKLPHVPIVTLSVKIDGIPCVRLDNKTGMTELVQHVITVHKKRKIAFIQGPSYHAYAQERLSAYIETLEKNNIAADPQLISHPGHWDITTGYDAVRLFLDERQLVPGTDIEAVICANDRIAVGVIEELSRRSWRCPEDIIVTGYNNLEEAKNNTPSITSASMPFSGQGAAAVAALEELLRGSPLPHDVSLPSFMAVHESCGCPNPLSLCRNIETARPISRAETIRILRTKKDTLAACPGTDLSSGQASIIFDCFVDSLEKGSIHSCLLSRTMLQHETGGSGSAGGSESARKFISFLMDNIYRESSDPELLRLAEALSGSMICMLTDYEERRMFKSRVVYIAQEERIQHMDRDLTIQDDIAGLSSVLYKHLRALGIPAAYLMLYSLSDDGSEQVLKTRFAYEDGVSVDVPPEGIPVQCDGVFPPPGEQRYFGQNFVIRPLCLKNEKLGCIVFRTGPLDGYIYESVAAKLNSAVKNVHMKEAIRHQSERIQKVNNELNISLKMLKETQEQLIESEKMASLGALVAGIAHEINTPVGIGVTVSSMLEEKLQGFESLFVEKRLTVSDFEKYIKNTRESVQILSNNMRKAAQLIQSFKQIAVDQSDEVIREFYIGKYIDDVLINLHPLYRKSGVKVKNIYSEDTSVLSNPGALSQIISNLLINSMTHAFPDGASGEISITHERKNDIMVIVYSDNGKGISEENLSKIFDPFFTTKRGSGGSGLGLYITYNLVTQSLKGTIKCTSAPDKGVQFYITFPVKRNAENN